MYLWALLPKDFTHDHYRAHDYFHTASEHCENVIYNVAVGDAHKCEHHTHIHTPPTHCFGCDHHYTSEHTAPVIPLLKIDITAALPDYHNQILFKETTLQELFNKGPPASSTLLV